MTKKSRNKHPSAFKAKVALAAIKGDAMVAYRWSASVGWSASAGRRSTTGPRRPTRRRWTSCVGSTINI